jgi:cyanophycinase
MQKQKIFGIFMSVFIGISLVVCNNQKDEPVIKSADQKLPKGKLFIIGGGDRTPELMTRMIEASGVDSTGYIAVLPMSSEDPLGAYTYFCADVAAISSVPCVNLNFRESDIINQQKLDSLKNAKLIFITGGDQSLFMGIARNTPIQDAIEYAFEQGSLIGGTSAGAAVMSEIMITGEQANAAEYEGTYDKMWKGNGIYSQGLGLIQGAIIDQHFVARSRYNRLFSAMCDYPGNMGIGIDEETAILVENRNATVVGDSQVIVVQPQDSCEVYFHHLGLRNVKMDIFVPGEKFSLPELKEKNKE